MRTVHPRNHRHVKATLIQVQIQFMHVVHISLLSQTKKQLAVYKETNQLLLDGKKILKLILKESQAEEQLQMMGKYASLQIHIMIVKYPKNMQFSVIVLTNRISKIQLRMSQQLRHLKKIKVMVTKESRQ